MRGRLQKLEGVVIKRSNLGEQDKLVVLFTRELGKITLKAPGVRKINSKRAAALELFNHVGLQISDHGAIPIISEVACVNRYPTFKKDLTSIGMAFYIAEIIDRLLPDRQAHPEIYSELLTVLSTLDRGEESSRRLIKEFIVHQLWNLGFLPRGEYPKIGVTSFVEEVAERGIKSRKFIDKIA